MNIKWKQNKGEKMNNELQEIVMLNNNKEYIVMERIAHNGNFFVMLVAYDENDDEIIIQKEVMGDNEFVLKPIETEEEFNAIIGKFAMKPIRP